jgi:hypothetical protein
LGVVFPEDINAVQSFDINTERHCVGSIRLTFESSSDFFGRVTVYTVDVLGHQPSA